MSLQFNLSGERASRRMSRMLGREESLRRETGHRPAPLDRLFLMGSRQESHPSMPSRQNSLLDCLAQLERKLDQHKQEKIAQERQAKVKAKRRVSKQVVVTIENKKREQRTVQRDSVSCLCKRTRCNKLYCICFKNGLGCTESCQCTNCTNTGGRESIKHRDFKKKILVNSQTEGRGQSCNCRRSFCQTKYCRCKGSSRGCSDLCTCISCKNKQG